MGPHNLVFDQAGAFRQIMDWRRRDLVSGYIMRSKGFADCIFRFAVTLLLCAAAAGCAGLGGGGLKDDPYASMTISQQIDRRLELGKQHKAAGRNDQAIAEYNAVLLVAPGNVDARNALAMLMATNGDLDGAARELKQAVSDQPHVPWLLSNLGHVYILQGRKRDAQMTLTKALARDPYFEVARVNLERADAMPDEQLSDRLATMTRDRLPPKSPIAKTRVRIAAIKGAETEARLLKDHLSAVGLNSIALEAPVPVAKTRLAGPLQQIRVVFRRGFGEAALLIGRQLPGQPLLEPSRSKMNGDVRIILGQDSLTDTFKSKPDSGKVIAHSEIPPQARH